MKWASDERRLAQACSAVLAFMHRHPISATWGRSDLASSDMMSMETSQRVFVARNDPRRLTPSVGIYSHTRDRWGISYAQPMVLNDRQAGPAIEGVVRDERWETAQLAVDTHGYALSLLANLVMAWNTTKMQPALDRWNARPSTAVPPELIGRIAPTRTEGINLRGVFTFPIEQYQAQLLPSLPAAKSRAFGG